METICGRVVVFTLVTGDGRTSTSLDWSRRRESVSSRSASTTMRGTHSSDSRRSGGAGRRTLSWRARSRSRWRGRRQGTLPARRRCWAGRDAAAAVSAGDGGGAAASDGEAPGSRRCPGDVDGDGCPSCVTTDEPISRSGSSSSIVYARTHTHTVTSTPENGGNHNNY